tara:strand:- start:175 stop:708 length:534 start_codon:yes stop_codon:yes gene_type:complete
MSSVSESVNTVDTVNVVSNVVAPVSIDDQLVPLDTLLATLITEGEELRNSSRLHLANVKKVVTLVNRERKFLSKNRRRKKRVIVQNPQNVNKTMQKFMKDNKDILSTGTIPVSTEYIRRDMMRVVSAYVKVKNLQLEENRKKWLPDKVLKKLFSIKDPKAEFSFMNVNGLITRVILK